MLWLSKECSWFWEAALFPLREGLVLQTGEVTFKIITQSSRLFHLFWQKSYKKHTSKKNPTFLSNIRIKTLSYCTRKKIKNTFPVFTKHATFLDYVSMLPNLKAGCLFVCLMHGR